MMTRRRLLRAMFAAACAPLAAAAGCAGVPILAPALAGNRLRLPVAEFDAAAEGRDALLVRAPGLPDPLVLLRDGQGAFSAVSSRCTHQGCRLRPARGFLTCPCHGSSFDAAGRVIRGPAQAPLPAYPVSLAGDVIEIHLAGEGG